MDVSGRGERARFKPPNAHQLKVILCSSSSGRSCRRFESKNAENLQSSLLQDCVKHYESRFFFQMQKKNPKKAELKTLDIGKCFFFKNAKSQLIKSGYTYIKIAHRHCSLVKDEALSPTTQY